MKWKIFCALALVHCMIAAANLKIGFDYDDTISFSTPAFQKAFEAEAQGIKPFSPEFWSIINKSHEIEEAKWGVIFWALMAKTAGFDIVIITVRLPVDHEELVEKWDWLHDGFYFTKDKARAMRRQRFAAFVGDSDSDMEECQKAGITAVRSRRSPKSSYKENYSPGKYGEWILPFSG
ncbi:MAG: hypothetical protein HY547_01910 [Elusimicrobia bacterium]|nr:hypothetical protein [Elusimicrobiota bacterium]